MKVMNCPLNGPRNISEFTYGGEFKQMPDPQTCTDAEWADYVFNSDDTLGVVCEWWMHNPSSYWFLACLLYTSPSPRDKRQSRMPSSA